MTERDATVSTGAQDGNLALALIVHYGVGFFWLFGLAELVGLLDTVAGVIWALCAVPLWIFDSVRMIRARRRTGRVWALTLFWFLKSFGAPLFLLLEGLALVGRDARSVSPEPARAVEQPRVPITPAWKPVPPNPGPAGFEQKLTDFARRLELLERELADLRRTAQTIPAQEAIVPPPPELPPEPVVSEPSPVPVAPPFGYQVPTKEPARVPPRPGVPPPPAKPEPPQPRWWSGLTLADLFGAKVLAWAGGIVTLLGVLFFFVLAVNRGWIGPVARVSLGAATSAIVFSAGLYVRRRYGHLYYSAYAAAGAGIGGGYGTLLAARLQYDLLSDWAALIIAAVIASIGVATALAWSSEFIAGLGLIGATVAPAAVGLQNGELSSAGTAFAALVFAGTAIVALGKRWQALLAIGVAATLPQVAVLVGQAEPTEWGVVTVAAVFWLLYLTSAVGLQVRFDSPALASVPSSLILVSAVFGGGAAAAQFQGSDEGWVLLAAAAVYGATAAALFPKRINRDLSALVAAVGLGIVAVALADLVSGPTLTIAWAAEAAVLAWLARRIGDVRYQVASMAYLGAALVHALGLDAPLRQLYQAAEHPASGGLAFVGIAVAGSIAAFYCRPWETAAVSSGILAPLQPALDVFQLNQRLWRMLVGSTSALAALYAASLGVLAIAEWIGTEVEAAFEWGHVAVIALWSATALGALAAGIRRSHGRLRTAGLIWLGVIVAQVVIYVAPNFDAHRRGIAFLVAAAALLTGALLDRLAQPEPSDQAPADSDVLPALGIAAAGLTIAAFGLADLLSGPPLAIAWAAGAAVLAWLARRVGEARYQAGSFAYLAVGLVHALALDAPFRQLYEASPRPAEDVLAFVGVALAGAVVAYFSRPFPLVRPPAALVDVGNLIDAFRLRQNLWRSIVGWTAAVAALYAASLGVLGLAEWISAGDVHRDFEWGQIAVAVLWGLVALAVLGAGHRWSLGELRAGGLVWLGVLLAHVLGYFPASLGGDRRDVGFVVVAAVLLAGSLGDRLLRPDRNVFPVIAVYELASLGLAVSGLVGLVAGGEAAQGAGLLLLAGFYCAVAAAVFARDRDLGTLLWAPALVVAGFSFTELFSGTVLVLAWAATAAILALAADRVGERRLQLASLAYLAPAVGHALWLEAPPSDFFQSSRHPAAGVPAVLFVAGAAAIFGLVSRTRPEGYHEYDALDAAVEHRLQRLRRSALAVTTVLAMFAVSLSILGLAEWVGNGSVTAKFHGGHSAVSAVWGLIGLVALYTGLSQKRVWLQAVGFGLFAVSLAKIFLYDLTFLSSVTRAFSFLAVGAVLLLGGFFVQRLGAERRTA